MGRDAPGCDPWGLGPPPTSACFASARARSASSCSAASAAAAARSFSSASVAFSSAATSAVAASSRAASAASTFRTARETAVPLRQLPPGGLGSGGPGAEPELLEAREQRAGPRLRLAKWHGPHGG